MTEPTRALMGITEAAEFFDMKKANIRKFLERHGVDPVAQLATGPVYDYPTLDRVRRKHLADLAARAADEKRRHAHAGESVTEVTFSELEVEMLRLLREGKQFVVDLLGSEASDAGARALVIVQLRERGLVEVRTEEAISLTETGREAADALA